MRALEGFLRKRFDEATAFPMEDVHSVDSFWRYFNESFKPAIYGEDTARYYFPGAVVPTWLQVYGPNYLYGMGRMRVLNVQPDSDCLVAQQYKEFFPTCYGPFSMESEDRTAYGPSNEEGLPSYSYFAEPTGSYEGWLAVYPSGGYMEVFTPDYIRSHNRFLSMQENGFISEKTRAIFLVPRCKLKTLFLNAWQCQWGTFQEFTTYNFNLGLYAVIRIVFEIAPAGDWTRTFEVDILLQRHLQPLGAGTTEDWFILILEAALVLFVLRYVLEEAAEFIGFESKNNKISVTIKRLAAVLQNAVAF